MAAKIIRAFLLTVIFAASVAADDGDDFVNNLFSDLAPLLALFGERVTMQFMSQSLGWADNILLAMVPLGIITIMISAIRVGGPGFLKALIGRARENLAVAEQELMSSTSTEVCELWNGHEVVRCMGSAPVAEFICLLPESGVTDDVQVEVMPFDEVKNRYFAGNEPPGNLLRKAMSLNLSTSTEKDREQLSHSANTPRSCIIITRNPRKSSPNITLNSHNITSRAEIRIAAVWGIVLQLGLIAYAGCSVHYPSLGLLKDEEPVAQYAFPCHWVGTLLLVVGLLLCGHVVESSTWEREYRPSPKFTARLIWLQKTKTVSDQVFDSFAIYTKSKRSSIITSERRRDEIKSLAHRSNQGVMSENAPVNDNPWSSSELKTSIGTVVSLCGYIVQFCGLRGLHWSVSIAQLGAILFMAGVRAWVRRGLVNTPRSLQIPPGFELDWFAMTFVDVRCSPWVPDAKYRTQEWRIGYLQAHNKRFEGGVPQEQSTNSIAHRLFVMRRDLAQLASWQGPAYAEAVYLARSIEATMNIMFRDSEQGNFAWSLVIHGGEPIYFRLNREGGKWRAHADELEAALSLWLFSVHEFEKNEETDPHWELGDHKGDEWLRAKVSLSGPGLRVLGSYTESLHRDLSWWMPSETARILRLSKLRDLPENVITADDLYRAEHRVVGPGGPKLNLRAYGVEELPEFATKTNRPEDDEDGDCEAWSQIWSRSGGEEETPATHHATEIDSSNHDLLAAEFHGPLELLYAQDIFSSFFKAAAMTLKEPLEVPEKTHPKREATADTDWKTFALYNSRLSKLAKAIESTGLGSLSDVYLSMIPALSIENKLSSDSGIINLARGKVRDHEMLQHWREAGEIYLWLFRVAKTFPIESEIFSLATVMIVDFLRRVSLAFGFVNKQEHEWDYWSPYAAELTEVSSSKVELEKELRLSFRGSPGVESIFAGLLKMYEGQKRSWNCSLSHQPTVHRGYSESNDEHHEKFHYTNLHEAARTQDCDRIKDALHRAEDVNAKDIFGWTPLHYGAHDDAVTSCLIEAGADINARDLVEWTPLHYACEYREQDDEIDYETKRGHEIGEVLYGSIESLIRAGADINAQGRDGVAPIHCAAITGFVVAVKLLIGAGVDINVFDALGETALHWAAFYGHTATLAYLWNIADRTLQDRKGRTALHLAVISGEWETVTWLIDNGADVMARDRVMRIPLHQAAWDGKLRVVRLMCDKNPAAVNASAGGILTPLRCAVMNGQQILAQWLIEEAKAEIDLIVPGLRMESPVFLAIKNDDVDIAKILIENGAFLESKNMNGRSLLQESILHGNEEITEMLLKAGVRGSFDDYGNSVIKMAMGGERERVFRSLLEKYDVHMDEE